jgi:hypothetical protein
VELFFFINFLDKPLAYVLYIAKFLCKFQKVLSRGEDRSIKIWDLREKKNVHTIAEQVNEVTAMLSLDDRTFIAGACPKNIIQAIKEPKSDFTI